MPKLEDREPRPGEKYVRLEDLTPEELAEYVDALMGCIEVETYDPRYGVVSVTTLRNIGKKN